MSKKSTKKVHKKYKRRPAHAQAIYVRWKKELAGIHNFSFKTRKNFTSHQKAAITRARKKYHHIIRGQRLGHPIRVIKATRSQIKAAGDRYDHTNIGLVVYSRADTIKSIKKSKQKATIDKFSKKRKRKIKKVYKPEHLTDEEVARLLRLDQLKKEFKDFDDRTLIIEKGKVRQQIFIPLLEGEKIDDLVDYVWYRFNPTNIVLAVGKGQATQALDKEGWEGYRETLLSIEYKVGEWQLDHGKPVESPFNGVYAVWHSGRQRRTNPRRRKKG